MWFLLAGFTSFTFPCVPTVASSITSPSIFIR
jgi:hypothetical protein